MAPRHTIESVRNDQMGPHDAPVADFRCIKFCSFQASGVVEGLALYTVRAPESEIVGDPSQIRSMVSIPF